MQNLLKLLKNKFVKNTLVLMFGTVLGQLILVVTTPLLTRIYSPAEYGIYGNFISFAAILSVIASLRYELAIVVPKKDSESLQIMSISIYILIINSIIFTSLLILFEPIISKYFSWYDNQFAIFTLTYIFFTGLFQIFNYWITRKQLFIYSAYAQVIRSFSIVLIQLFLGYFFIGIFKSSGLIFGHIIGQTIAFLVLFFVILKFKTKPISFNFSEMFKTAVKYKEFPVFSSGTSLINTISNHLPIIMLTYYFSTSISGLYLLANRILAIPIGILGNAIAQVFLQKTAKDRYDAPSNKNAFKLWKYLMPISFGINFTIFLLAPTIFKIVFGDAWVKAGEFARILSIWTLFKFVGTPMSSISYTYNKQKHFFIYQLIVFLGRLVALIIGGIYSSVTLAVLLFSIVGALFNIKTTVEYVEIESGTREAKIVKKVNIVLFIFMLLIFYILLSR